MATPTPSATNSTAETGSTTYFENVQEHASSTWERVQSSKCARWTIDTFEKIQRVVTPIFLTICAIGLFLSNSSLFVLGVVASVASPKTTDITIERIVGIWRKLNWVFKTIVVLTSITFALPISLALGSFFAGAKLSLYLQDYDRAKDLSTSFTSSTPTLTPMTSPLPKNFESALKSNTPLPKREYSSP